jgi:hypothetical protein
MKSQWYATAPVVAIRQATLTCPALLRMLRTRVYKSTSTKFDATAFTEPWETCINCKQSFKGQLALDMGTTLVVFAESTYYNVDDNSSNPPLVVQQQPNVILSELKIRSHGILSRYSPHYELKLTSSITIQTCPHHPIKRVSVSETQYPLLLKHSLRHNARQTRR